MAYKQPVSRDNVKTPGKPSNGHVVKQSHEDIAREKIAKELPFLNYLKSELESIHSPIDAEHFLFTKYSMSMKPREYTNRTIILNFSEDGNHGCRIGCSYCCWAKNPLSRQVLCPSDEEIEVFLDGFKGYVVTLAGGGDPLYHYEKNKGDLIRIINKVRSLGYLVEVITREYKFASQLFDNELSGVSLWSFSIDVELPLLGKLLPQLKFPRVSKVYQGEDMQHMKKYLSYYIPITRGVLVREDVEDNNFSLLGKDSINDLRHKYPSAVFLFDHKDEDNTPGAIPQNLFLY